MYSQINHPPNKQMSSYWNFPNPYAIAKLAKAFHKGLIRHGLAFCCLRKIPEAEADLRAFYYFLMVMMRLLPSWREKGELFDGLSTSRRLPNRIRVYIFGFLTQYDVDVCVAKPKMFNDVYKIRQTRSGHYVSPDRIKGVVLRQNGLKSIEIQCGSNMRQSRQQSHALRELINLWMKNRDVPSVRRLMFRKPKVGFHWVSLREALAHLREVDNHSRMLYERYYPR